MYNGQNIKHLLLERNVSNKELLEYLGYTNNASIRQLTHGNPSVNRLEKVADFFGVSMDVFFDREKEYVKTNENVSASQEQLLEKVNYLEKLLEEKDKRIVLLEEMYNILSSQYKR